MATDWVTLFDLDLAKTVLRLDRTGLARFLHDRGPALAERDRRQARELSAELAAALPALQEGFARFFSRVGIALPETPADTATKPHPMSELEKAEVERATSRWTGFTERLHRGEDLEELRASVSWAAGTLGNELRIDYWGCAAEALAPFDLDRTCETNLLFDPGDPDGAHVFFLLPEHVDAMIASLREHWSEVTVMDEADLRRLVDHRKRCATEPGIRLAYHIDY